MRSGFLTYSFRHSLCRQEPEARGQLKTKFLSNTVITLVGFDDELTILALRTRTAVSNKAIHKFLPEHVLTQRMKQKRSNFAMQLNTTTGNALGKNLGLGILLPEAKISRGRNRHHPT